MKRKFFYTLLATFLLIVAALCNYPSARSTNPSVNLVVAGGGSLGDEIREHLLSLSPAENPNVLIIPQAAQEENRAGRGKGQSEVFAKLGVKQISVLELEDTEHARSQIAAADVIWMPAGGTSAGAAIMSNVMIANSSRDEETGILQPGEVYRLKD